MKTNRRTETLSITTTPPTYHFRLAPLLLSEKMFTTLELSSLFSPLKKKGIEISTRSKPSPPTNSATTSASNVLIPGSYQPETREYYNLPSFTGKTLYRLLETLGQNSAFIIS